jgi:hypothetical protein
LDCCGSDTRGSDALQKFPAGGSDARRPPVVQFEFQAHASVHQRLAHDAKKAIPGADNASPYQFGNLPVTVRSIGGGHDMNATWTIALALLQQCVNRRSNLTPRIAASVNVTLMQPLQRPMRCRLIDRAR